MDPARITRSMPPIARLPPFQRFIVVTIMAIALLTLLYPKPSDDLLVERRRFKTSEAPPIDLEAIQERQREAWLKQAIEKGSLPPLAEAPKSPKRSLRDRLAYYYPYTEEVREKPYPLFIWQTWKRTLGDESFEARLRPFAEAWKQQNPESVYEIITDDYAVELVAYYYRHIPEVVEAYNALPQPVLKADFFRYLILFARGGVYSDIDTEALRPIHEWVPDTFGVDAQGLTVGIEADPDRPDWAKWYARRIQFCQWTIRAKPGHPALLEAVARITELTRKKKKANLLSIQTTSVMEWTGPGVWTDALMDYFNTPEVVVSYNEQNKDKKNFKPVKKIDYTVFTNMEHPLRVGDVVVLPITGFSPDQGHMGSKPSSDPDAMVKHHFDGTWKPDDERMN